MTHRHEVTKIEAAPGTAPRGSLADGVRRLTYASLGLFSVMTDEVAAFYEKCVTRGEQKAQAARAATRERQVAHRARGKTARAGQPIAAVLDRSGLATKSEVDTLSAQVDALAREIDVLAEQRKPR